MPSLVLPLVVPNCAKPCAFTPCVCPGKLVNRPSRSIFVFPTPIFFHTQYLFFFQPTTIFCFFFPTEYLFFQPQSSFSSFYFSLCTVPRRAKPLCHVPPPFVRSSRRCLSPLPKRFLHNLQLNACFPAPLLLLTLPHAVQSPPHVLCQPPQDKSQSCDNPWPLVSLCVSGKHR